METKVKLETLHPFLRIDSRLSLHLAQPELIDHVFHAVDANREHLRRWLPWVDATQSVADTEVFIKRSMAANSEGSQLVTFIIFDNRLAGSLSVVGFNADRRSCELGYWLGADLQGRGIMTRCAAALIDWLFQRKKLHRIEIFAATENVASQAVCRRLGFTHEGTLRKALWLYDRYYDLELFAMLDSEWETISHRFIQKNV